MFYLTLYGLVSTTQLTKTKISYPLSLSEVKRHLRLDNDFVDDDDYIMTLINAGTQIAENYIGKDIALTSNTLRIDNFGTFLANNQSVNITAGFNGDYIKIFDGNFLSVTSVLDGNSNPIGTIAQTSKHEDYFLIEWVQSITGDPITINYLTGFNDTITIPEVIKQAILVKISDLYDSERSSYNFNSSKKGDVFENLLNFYKNYQ